MKNCNNMMGAGIAIGIGTALRVAINNINRGIGKGVEQ